MIYPIDRLAQPEKIELLREIFQSLPDKIRENEADRQIRIVRNEPVYYIDDGDAIYRATDAPSIKKIVENLTGREPDISNIYKVLKSGKEQTTIYGLKIKKIYEEDKKHGTFN
jgi:hypothetical protein